MKRSTKQFLNLANSLDRELDKNLEMFFSKRAFLLDPTQERVIDETRTDEDIEAKVDNDYAIEAIINNL